ncbi:MAG: hypothetical protein FWD31_06560, partial [Planctomycetaceae bacterium]|nr:hypothetical protein [Planctomycetaceae bacterium]
GEQTGKTAKLPNVATRVWIKPPNVYPYYKGQTYGPFVLQNHNQDALGSVEWHCAYGTMEPKFGNPSYLTLTNVPPGGKFDVYARTVISNKYEPAVTNLTFGVNGQTDDIEFEFITPAGDPGDPAQMNDSGNAGTNQYTYDDKPVGEFKMYLQVKVSPPGTAAKITGQCRFVVDKVGDSVIEWAPGNVNGKPHVVGDTLRAVVTYKGLPEQNNDFGWKTVRLHHNFMPEPVATATYGVYFTKSANNHPQCTHCENCTRQQNPDNCANWYYYWKKGDVCGIPHVDCTYDSTLTGYGMLRSNDLVIVLGPQSANKARKNDAFTARTKTENNENLFPNTSYPPIIIEYGKGIYFTATAVTHEKIHRKFRLKLFGDPPPNLTDADNDRVPDELETSGHMDVHTATNTKDTYLLGNEDKSYEKDVWGYKDYGDEEIRCRVQSINFDFDVFPNKDWSNPGSQHKIQHDSEP